jgi:hypothetical protein
MLSVSEFIDGSVKRLHKPPTTQFQLPQIEHNEPDIIAFQGGEPERARKNPARSGDLSCAAKRVCWNKFEYLFLNQSGCVTAPRKNGTTKNLYRDLSSATWNQSS